MKVSIIVPIYNSATTIEKCVCSILSQTYSDFELVLVNDGSTDTSGRICDTLSKKDSRIKVIHKNNGGSTSARTVGISNSSGDFIYFCDADDFISEDTIECMLHYVDNDVDIVIFESDFNIIYSIQSYAEALLSFKHWCVWGKLYRRTLFDEFVMSVPKYFYIGEDFITNLRLLKNIRGKIVCIPIHKYHYQQFSATSVQRNLRTNYAYEIQMIEEVEQSLKGLHSKFIHVSILHWKLAYLCGMIGLKYPISYSEPWIKKLLKDIEKTKDIRINCKERIAIAAIDNKYLRVPFILEKKIGLIKNKIKVALHESICCNTNLWG